MRVPPSIEEDQVACMRPDNRAVPFHGVNIGRCRVVREDEFAARARWLIRTEEKASQWI
jgi:hypothetical protein